MEAPTEAKLVQPPIVPFELFAELWNWESKGPVPKGRFQMYEHQRELFLLVVKLKCGAWVGHSQFLQLWQQSSEWGDKNLFAEIMSR